MGRGPKPRRFWAVLIEARDRNEAVGIAERIPGASIGCVEVRPVAEDSRTLDILGTAKPGRA